MVADLGQSPWVEQLPPAHDHGHGVNEQREAVAQRPIKSDQERKRQYELGNAQDVRCRYWEHHSVKVTGDTRGRVRENELLDTPLQQKNAEKESQEKKRGGNASIDFRRHLASPWSSSPPKRHFGLLQPVRNCTIGAHHVRYAVGQDQFQPVDGFHSK